MCGIGGTAGFADRGVLLNMNLLMKHRGPDDDGVAISSDGTVGLSACRLSILDLSAAGHMPMTNPAGTLTVAHNGEISNFRELRAELERAGYNFRSNSDTEVLLHGYDHWRAGLFARLNGMFAIAIMDETGRGGSRGPRLTLARDRFGIKPLYYTVRDGRVVFASEAKAIVEASGAAAVMNLAAIPAYLMFLWVPGPQTMFSGIQKLPPGHTLVWENGECRIAAFWELTFGPIDTRSETVLAGELREILGHAVDRNLISDVPVGLFLSGGLDSTTILALAAAAGARDINAYSIGYRDRDARLEQSGEDLHYSRMVAGKYGARLHEILLTPDVSALLPQIVYHLDEPVGDPAAVASYAIGGAARGDVKVLLSGQGADEVFAGYRTYWIASTGGALRWMPASIMGAAGTMASAAIGAFGRTIGPRGLSMAAQRYVRRTFAGAALPPGERFVRQHAHLTTAEIDRLLSSDLREALSDEDPRATHLRHFEAGTGIDFLSRMLYTDVHTFLPEQNLTYGDRMSSAHSLEVRVPFLDNEVVEFMSRVPSSLKLHRFESKRLLKAAVRGLVPDEVVTRRKAGFGAPVRAWLQSELVEMVDDLLGESQVRNRGLFDVAEVRRLVEDQRSGRRDNPLAVWALLSLELWMRTFVDAPMAAAASGEVELPRSE